MNTQPLERKTIGEYRYEVFFDQYDESIHDMDFENEEQKKEYIDKFQSGKLNSFGVVKSKVCQCCCLWSEVSSLWGMHYEYAIEALNDFMSYND
jgi:hypothetical protein